MYYLCLEETGESCWLKSFLWRNVKSGNQAGTKSIMDLLVDSAYKLIISMWTLVSRQEYP